MERHPIKQSITPTRAPQRYFGVDFYATLLEGSNPSYRYFSALNDPFQTYSEDEIQIKLGALSVFKDEIKHLSEQSIIGFCQNPDIYDLKGNSDFFIDIYQSLAKNKLGVYIETSSMRIVEHFDFLKEINQNAPVIINVPIAFNQDILIKQFGHDESPTYDYRLKLIKKIKEAGFICGVLFKPIVPYMNDSISFIDQLVSNLSAVNVDYIYPSFVLSVSSEQRENLMKLISSHYPGLKNRYMDLYGNKKTWTSPYLSQVKKEFVIQCKKNHIKYGMKEIVSLVKPSQLEQITLF